ncbi:putative tumor suppressing sub-chromosomal transferable candidate 4 [Helianthus debilis subsp. tardiflorus]
MDDGFKDRVDKVFGSISSSSTSWSLTDAQVQRREWRRDETQRDDDRIPVFSSSFNDDDDLDIRSSIGLDPTLDNEEEEDAYDKMAQGRENGGDRLYMKDVTDHGLYLNAHNVHVLPTSLHQDSRAAKTRLNEDDDDAAAALQGSDEPMLTSEDAIVSIKPILKRRQIYDCEEAKPAKRVRFHSTCKSADAAPPPPESFGLTHKTSGNWRSVPDYILNPSKYTRYTFDDESNSEAYLKLLEQISKSSKHDTVGQKSCGELPKSVVFIPRKKRGDAGYNSEEQVKQSSTQACSTVGIAAVEVQQGEMQEDGVYTKARSQKPVRQYRSKMEEYDDDDIS